MKIFILLLTGLIISCEHSAPYREPNYGGMIKAFGDGAARSAEQARQQQADNSFSKAANSHNQQATTYTPPARIDYKCQSDCQRAGYALNLCAKQCSY